MLDSMPLTPNGKLDRTALPAPDHLRPSLDTPFVAPKGSVEELLAKIWAEVLSVDRVGVHDDFFDLGGHSLAASRVIARVIKHFRLEIPLQSLFSSPSVAEMAAVINDHQRKKLSGKELEQILTEVESLSDEEAQKRLSESTSAVVKNK